MAPHVCPYTLRRQKNSMSQICLQKRICVSPILVAFASILLLFDNPRILIAQQIDYLILSYHNATLHHFNSINHTYGPK